MLGGNRISQLDAFKLASKKFHTFWFTGLISSFNVSYLSFLYVNEFGGPPVTNHLNPWNFGSGLCSIGGLPFAAGLWRALFCF